MSKLGHLNWSLLIVAITKNRTTETWSTSILEFKCTFSNVEHMHQPYIIKMANHGPLKLLATNH